MESQNFHKIIIKFQVHKNQNIETLRPSQFNAKKLMKKKIDKPDL